MISKEKASRIYGLLFLLSIVVVGVDWVGFSIIQSIGISSSPRSGLVFLVAIWICFGSGVGGLLVDGPRRGSIVHSLLWSGVWLGLLVLVSMTVILCAIHWMDGG